MPGHAHRAKPRVHWRRANVTVFLTVIPPRSPVVHRLLLCLVCCCVVKVLHCHAVRALRSAVSGLLSCFVLSTAFQVNFSPTDACFSNLSPTSRWQAGVTSMQAASTAVAAAATSPASRRSLPVKHSLHQMPQPQQGQISGCRMLLLDIRWAGAPSGLRLCVLKMMSS